MALRPRSFHGPELQRLLPAAWLVGAVVAGLRRRNERLARLGCCVTGQPRGSKQGPEGRARDVLDSRQRRSLKSRLNISGNRLGDNAPALLKKLNARAFRKKPGIETDEELETKRRGQDQAARQERDEEEGFRPRGREEEREERRPSRSARPVEVLDFEQDYGSPVRERSKPRYEYSRDSSSEQAPSRADSRDSKERAERGGARPRKKSSEVEEADEKLARALRPEQFEVNDVELICRSFFLSQCPAEDGNLPEIAVFGRSNVGKSSLINMLCKRKLLSTVSKRPGHTKLLHHFLINNSWYLVDLPGVGGMQATGKQKKNMSRIVQAYIRHRRTLVAVMYLVDASLPVKRVDLDGIKWLYDLGLDVCIVFTKTDKPPMPGVSPLGAGEGLAEKLWSMEGSPFRLGKDVEMPDMFYTSSAMKTGRETLLQHIALIREYAVVKGRPQKGKAAVELTPQVVTPAGPPPAIR